jgi:hypothetical protein
VPKFLLPRKSLPQLPPPPFSGSRYDATCLDYSQASFYLLILPSQIYGFHPLSLGDILLKKTPGARSCSLLPMFLLPRRVYSSVRVLNIRSFNSSGVSSSARVLKINIFFSLKGQCHEIFCFRFFS